MVLASREAFFNAWPFHTLPARDGLLIPLDGASGRSLQLQPMRTRSLQTCALWYRTPKWSSMTSATRSHVHRFVAYPAASGPDSRMSPKPSISSSLNRGRRPARPALRNASTPLEWKSAAHRLTDWRCTPTRRATSACDTPVVG